MKKKYTFLAILLLSLTFVSCVEETDFVSDTETFESALVIEATITNELKQQEIKLSRSYQFEAEGPSPETHAFVTVMGGAESHIFTETDPGVYTCLDEFRAQPNIDYQLVIKTSDDRSYSSDFLQLTQTTNLDNLYAVRENNDAGINGMSIYIDSFDPLGESNYYRYEYEETYKIIAPRFVPEEIVLTDPLTCEVELRDRIQEERVCYNTVNSLNINLFNTSQLAEDRVSRHLIRFIDSEDYILTYRYTIKVKQYIQSLEAHTFYKTLKEFSDEGSIFSQVQPGFISGNIVSDTNPNEKIIGFFDVSTVSERRIFFDFDDFYSGEPIPRYPSLCNPRVLAQYSIAGGCGTLISGLLLDQVTYYSGASKIPDTIFSVEGEIIRIDTLTIGPFNMVSKLCGDCTALGSNVVPEFWVD